MPPVLPELFPEVVVDGPVSFGLQAVREHAMIAAIIKAAILLVVRIIILLFLALCIVWIAFVLKYFYLVPL